MIVGLDKRQNLLYFFLWNLEMTYSKVWTAGREDHPMGPQKLAFSTEGHIHQTFLLQQSVKDRKEGGPVVVPLQTKLFFRLHV